MGPKEKSDRSDNSGRLAEEDLDALYGGQEEEESTEEEPEGENQEG